MVELIAQPTTAREYRSTMAAKYSHPSRVQTQVMFVTQTRFGSSTWKSRSSRLSAIGNACF